MDLPTNSDRFKTSIGGLNLDRIEEEVPEVLIVTYSSSESNAANLSQRKGEQ
jgi:hypothetical protein